MTWHGTRTWNVGDAATAADFNAYIRDNMAFLYGDIVPTQLTLTSPWAAYGAPFAAPQIAQHGNIVQISGVIQCSAAVGAGAILVADVGTNYHPAHEHILSVDTTTGHCRMDITPAGALVATPSFTSGAYLSLNSSYSLIS